MLPITIASILLGLALLVLLALFLARPFFKAPAAAEVERGPQQELMARKEALLDAIRALDFDHETGKMPDEEFETQRAHLMSEAAATLQALDSLPAVPPEKDVYAQIEAAVSALRSRPASANNGARGHYCANCGHALDSNDKFCAHCGQPIFQMQPSL
jgi:hypothetical protein